jgi:ElaB/YqjD/DUF883 family membrane-anchored ribosome-binding protein
MSDQTAPTTERTPQELERIRDIILGPQIRLYEQRFQQIGADLERFQQLLGQLEEQLSETDRTNEKKLQTLRRELRQSDEEIRQELRRTNDRLVDEKADRRMLGELFITLGNQLKSGGSLTDLLRDLKLT